MDTEIEGGKRRKSYVFLVASLTDYFKLFNFLGWDVVDLVKLIKAKFPQNFQFL